MHSAAREIGAGRHHLQTDTVSGDRNVSAIEPKQYQLDTLERLTSWLTAVAGSGDADTAFYQQTRRAYQAVEGLPGIPYACLRIPTGGGKTLVAAFAIGRASDALLKTDTPTAVWLVPSAAILEQTLQALRDRSHPYRLALEQRFGENVRVISVSEALYTRRAEFDGGAVVIVATIQSFRQEETDALNVYKDNGELMDHFTGLEPGQLAALEPGPAGRPIRSLANALKLRRPLVIVDEAHNARTSLSFVTLARLDPSLIIELTATPAADSNILHHVSAAELKDAHMIKLPIVLRGKPDWKETLRLAKAQLEELIEAADAEERATREHIRPIMLIQAQAARGVAPLTPGVVKQVLIDDFLVPEEQIKIATGSEWQLDGVDLADRAEPTRFVITVQALREGWDCPSAYVLCTLAEQRSSTAVEQMLGRVMRLPRAKQKRDDRLNRAYAFATTASFQEAANALAEGLVANGFERLEARSLIRAAPELPLSSRAIESEAIDDGIDLTPIAKQVAAVTNNRVTLNPQSRRFAAAELTKSDAVTLQLTVPAILADQLHAFIRKFDEAPQKEVFSFSPGFSTPLLAVRKEDQAEIFDQSHFLDYPWRLEACDASLIADRFAAPSSQDQEAIVDIVQQGRIGVNFVTRLQKDLALAVDERDWPYPRLVRWLDARLAFAKGPDVTQASAQMFIKAGLAALMANDRFNLDDLRHYRFRLVDAFARLISELRETRASDSFEACLFGNSLEFVAAPDVQAVFEPASYHPIKLYEGHVSFPKHLRPDLIAHMNMEEERCAVAIETHPRVKRWVRNIERLPSSFRLRISDRWFYPDFVAQLDDGSSLVVEYKGRGTEGPADRTDEKRIIGQRWAQTTGCTFVMPFDQDYDAVARALSV
jgi:type III restriction enzyme